LRTSAASRAANHIAKAMTRAVALAAVAISAATIAFGQQPAIALGDKVEAGSCAIANSSTAIGNTNICNFGLTPEQLKELTDAAVRGATEPLAHQIVEIGKTLGVTEDAAKSLLRTVGEDPNVPEDKLAEALSKAGDNYKKALAQVAALKPDNTTAKALVEQAKPEIEAGHFDRAHDLLHQATETQIAAAQEARKLKEQAQTAEDAQMLGAADSTAAEGDVALTERRFTEAAELFGRAAGYVPESDPNDQGEFLVRQADALSRQGDERGDNDALRRAISLYKAALSKFPRSKAPLAWALTQNNLGNALIKLGERESGTANLEAAVAAHRAALEILIRDLNPFIWAMVQSNLGSALVELGEMESGTTDLDAAVTADRAALEVLTRDLDPPRWAGIQNNLGLALERLGEREVRTARLEAAAAAFRAALEERTRDRAPLDWAMIENNLSITLFSLGNLENGTANLEAAVGACRAALEERTRHLVPRDWALTQNNLGNALFKLGERESGTANLEAAVSAYRAALEVLTRDWNPPHWASTQNNLGLTLLVLGKRESGTANLEAAVATYDAALEERARDRVPIKWAESFGNQGVAKSVIADRTNDADLAESAVQQIASAFETTQSAGHERLTVYFFGELQKAKTIRNRLRGKM
jgi:tetratricopeptide (TPR) repeat protein